MWRNGTFSADGMGSLRTTSRKLVSRQPLRVIYRENGFTAGRGCWPMAWQVNASKVELGYCFPLRIRNDAIKSQTGTKRFNCPLQTD